MRPKIGIMPFYNTQTNRIELNLGYTEAIERAGGLPFLLPLTSSKEVLDQLIGEMDGFLISGGQDVNPALYGQKMLECCQEICPPRDEQDVYLIKRALELDKPLLAICRGSQMFNVVLGGTLYQDLPSQYIPPETASTQAPLVHNQEEPYHTPVHGVTIVEGTRLHSCLGVSGLQVNSIHHQGILQLAPGLVASAYAEDGLIEGIEVPQARMAMAVQWHPELMDHDASRRLFALLVNSCRH
ncbi:MAG: hypothetical protein K0Q90_593, partial [Paenibacillaceae bacterium]|nr:hypothetical protein [Paenibacillaceae bacterium]